MARPKSDQNGQQTALLPDPRVTLEDALYIIDDQMVKLSALLQRMADIKDRMMRLDGSSVDLYTIDISGQAKFYTNFTAKIDF